MKTCYVIPAGKIPKIEKAMYVRITEENFTEVYHQYRSLDSLLVLLVGPGVAHAGLLKFVEDYTGELSVVVHSTPDTVFLSRFPRVVYKLVPIQSQVFTLSPVEELLKEVKSLCLSR